MDLNSLDPAAIAADRPILSRWVVIDRRNPTETAIAIVPSRAKAALWILNRRFTRTLIRDGWLLGIHDHVLPEKVVTSTARIMPAGPFDTIGTLTERFLDQETRIGSITLQTESEWRDAHPQAHLAA